MLTKEQESEQITVTLTRKRYLELLNADDKLRLLENSGVDNWSFYDDALSAGEDDDNYGFCQQINLKLATQEKPL
jgi:hypothetical protein